LTTAREAGHAARRNDVRRNVRMHRERLRAKGLRPVQFWLPDLRLAETQSEASRQSRAIAWRLGAQLLSAPAAASTLRRGELRLLSNPIELDTDPIVQVATLNNTDLRTTKARSTHARSTHVRQRFLVTDARPGAGLLTGSDLEAARIVAIVLDDAFDALPTTLVCPLTPALCPAPLLRVAVAPTPDNGLEKRYQLMLDALMSLPRTRLGPCIGRLADDDLTRLNQALLVALGLAR